MMRATDVAARIGLAPKTVRDLARRGELPALRFGARGHYRFDRDAIERLVACAAWDPAQSTAQPSERSGSSARWDPGSSTEGEQ